MNDLQIFKNAEFGEIRTDTSGNEPMFCLSDVCRALEIANVGNVKQWLSEMGIRTVEPLLTEQIVISGRKRGGIFINESRLCSLILSSWTLINLATKQRRV